MKKAALVIFFVVVLLVGGWLVLPLVFKPQQPVVFDLPITATPKSSNPDILIITPLNMNLTSSAFSPGGTIPREYTCDGHGQIPDLTVAAAPENTVSLAIIVSDTDAPSGEFIHWLVWDLPASTREIKSASLPQGAMTGKNSGGSAGYYPPCPPSGTHHYYFKVYALDNLPVLTGNAGAAELRAAMEGHILMQAELLGLYSRN